MGKSRHIRAKRRTRAQATAERIRQKGRGGDTLLAHINPAEAALLKRAGGSGTKNPATGLLEFRERGETDAPSGRDSGGRGGRDGGGRDRADPGAQRARAAAAKAAAKPDSPAAERGDSSRGGFAGDGHTGGGPSSGGPPGAGERGGFGGPVAEGGFQGGSRDAVGSATMAQEFDRLGLLETMANHFVGIFPGVSVQTDIDFATNTTAGTEASFGIGEFAGDVIGLATGLGPLIGAGGSYLDEKLGTRVALGETETPYGPGGEPIGVSLSGPAEMERRANLGLTDRPEATVAAGGPSYGGDQAGDGRDNGGSDRQGGNGLLANRTGTPPSIPPPAQPAAAGSTGLFTAGQAANVMANAPAFDPASGPGTYQYDPSTGRITFTPV